VERWIGALLRAYPESFRDRHGDEMAAFWREQWSEARYRGALGVMRFFGAVVWDAVTTGLRLRWSGRGDDERMMKTTLTDLKYTWKSLRAAPAFTLMAGATLALGIAATTSVFAVVEGVVLRPLPYPDADRLAVVLRTDQEGASTEVAWPDLQDWRAEAASFVALAGWAEADESFEWDEGAETLPGALVTRDFFDVMGVPLHLGRTFTEEEDRAGGPAAIVLSHGLWVRRFGSDPAVLGRSVPLSIGPTPVVGVAAEGFAAPVADAEYWLPLQDDALLARVGLPTGGRSLSFIDVVGRLRDGMDLASAQESLRAIAQRIDESVGKSDEQRSHVTMQPLAEWTLGDVSSTLYFLLAAALLVLVVATANVAGLALSRAAARQRELAVRRALGADRPRLTRQLLTEGLVLAALAGFAGTLLAWTTLSSLVALAPPGLPRADAIGMRGATLLFALVATVATGTLFGLLPAVLAPRSTPAASLAGGRGSSDGGRALRPQQLLAAFQMAISVVLLSGASLLTASFWRLVDVERGFDAHSVVVATVAPSEARYDTPDKVTALYEELLERVRGLPGVAYASTTYSPPMFGNGFYTSVVREGEQEVPEQRNWVGTVIVGPDYFEANGIELLRGRPFGPDDRLGQPPVVIVSESMADRLWPGQDPLGKRLEWTGGIRGSADSFDRAFFPDEPLTVVGVAADVRRVALDRSPEPEYYRPHTQITWGFQYLMVRAEGEPEAVGSQLRAAVWGVDPSIPVREIRTLEDRISQTVAPQRFRTLLLVAFAAMTCLLAVVGVYAVMALAVNRRVREMGIRIALGASRTEVVKGVLAQGLRIVGAGTALGVVLAIVAGSVLGSMLDGLLFEVHATDPWALLFVVGVTALIGLGACWGPARRAGRVDPIRSLQGE
jgi:putative ABC transport system permease protein